MSSLINSPFFFSFVEKFQFKNSFLFVYFCLWNFCLISSFRYPPFVDTVLQNICNPNSQTNNTSYSSFIHFAASFGKLSYLEYYIEEGLDFEARDPDTCYTPLLCAAWSDKLNTFEFLVQKGADINAQDNATMPEFMGSKNNFE